MNLARIEMNEFMRIYERNKSKLYNYVFKMLFNKEASEDITQTVFLKLYENIHSIDGINNIDAWLFVVARNEVFSYLRKKKINRKFNQESDMQDVVYDAKISLLNEIELNDFKEHLQKALERMEENQREIFLLKEYGGFSYKEIATMLNIEVDLVKSRLYKVRQKLIRNLNKIIN